MQNTSNNQNGLQLCNYMPKIPKEVKRPYTIGTGDFSYMCKVARHEPTNFPSIITYQHPDARVK